ncbi:MAG: hypothetical protein K8U57_27155 [Planctomycetes bacterium]|nr:hypothetical protein [Planctomycetota bacterium]
MNPNPIERLLELPAFDSPPDDLFAGATAHCVRSLRDRFPRYAEFLAARGNDPLPAIFLPVFKSYPFPLPAEMVVARTLTSSGTTGKPSLTPLDEQSWDYRVRAMRQSYAALGLLDGDVTALCFLMDPATTQMAGSVVIDAVLKSVPQVKAIHYLARMTPTGPLFLAEQAPTLFAQSIARGPVVLVGYPALITAMMQGMSKLGRTSFPLPAGSRILTGGGWKSFLPGLALDRKEFRTQAAAFFGIPDDAIRDMYGLSECPAVFVECERGSYHVPAWCRAEAVDPETMKPTPENENGLLQLTCPLTLSYPLVKILTTDMAQIRNWCPCGRAAASIIPKGRVTAARFETCAMKIGEAVR